MEPTTIVGIDVGTTKICTLVAEVNRLSEIRILGSGVVPSAGIRKGVITNINEATSAIMASIQAAEKASGYEIVSAYVGLAGSHVNAINNQGSISINHGHRTIIPDHITQALEAAKTITLPQDRQILHVIPRDFTVDSESGIRDPLGMYAQQLEVEAHVVTGATTAINNIVKCVQDAHIEVDALVLEPIASGEAVLTDMEKEMGVVLVDIGGGTTDIAAFIEGSIWHTMVLPTGGEQLTNDIAVGLRTPLDDAEEIKIRFGHAIPDEVPKDELVEISAFGSTGQQDISRHFLAEIIQARVDEIFELVSQEIKRTGYDDLLPAGVVLCGGTANLTGIKEVAQQTLNMPVRLGTPQHLRGVIDRLNEPAYATSVGLLEWGKHHQPDPTLGQRTASYLKIPNWLRVFLPG
ncbi:MAG: cell division protein FtsA [Chloroflexota bacterium]